MMSGLFGLRILHWGPLLGLLIIKCNTITTLYMTNMWLPMTSSLIGLVNHLIFLSLVGLTLYHFFCAIFLGPGQVPPGWKPKDPTDTKFLQFCSICLSYKCPRAHHCRTCNKCILKMDHHCPWINNCVGLRNHLNFTLFLLSAVLGGFHSALLLSIAIYRGYHAVINLTIRYSNSNSNQPIYSFLYRLGTFTMKAQIRLSSSLLHLSFSQYLVLDLPLV